MEDTLFWCLAAALVHELGHALAARCLRVAISRLRITVVGAEMVLRPSQLLSYPQELVIILSGPAINLVTGLLVARVPDGRAMLFAGSSVILGLFNLLPLTPLDGGQAVRAAASLLISPWVGSRLSALLNAVGTAVLIVAGIWALFQTGRNLSLLSVGLWALISSVEQVRKKSGLVNRRAVG